jgi:hypothetical protein
MKPMNFRDRLALIAAENGPDTCWEWPGFCFDGYGKVMTNLDHRGPRNWFAHLAAYTVLVGPVPTGLELDHLCRNRRCMNPAHLEPVTPRVNTLRSESFAAKHARQTHCKRGHEFTPENTRLVSTGRSCLTCERQVWAKDRNERVRKFGPLGKRTHCKRGHEFTPENTIHRIEKGKHKRSCRTCMRASWRRFVAKKRVEKRAS